MIVYDLSCLPNAHRFEGWFGSSDDFARQQARGLVTCPVCGSPDVAKVVSAPNLGRKGNQRGEPARSGAPAAAPVQAASVPMSPQAIAVLHTIAQFQAEALKSSTWVGDKFTEQARAMHYGETDPAPIHGQATPEDASALAEEGIDIAPILFPVVPPGKAN